MKKTEWIPRQSNWNAASLIGEVNRSDIALDEQALSELKNYFWVDLCAEWDSKYLHDELHKHGQSWSHDFIRFEEAWYEDEMNHAEGFVAIYSLLYGESKTSILKRLNERTPDFGTVADFIKSEFDLCLLFAYDELATMRAYHLDIELYQSLGPSQFQTWIRMLLKDETYHHKNGFDLVLRNHAHRLSEVDSRIHQFLEYDAKNPPYKATFIFDHEWDHVASDFFATTAKVLTDKFETSKPASTIR
ncbi:MAG: hypothetical protein ACI97A_002789 [Planctomycetota bacterium]|jgi:hypothetical protein